MLSFPVIAIVLHDNTNALLVDAILSNPSSFERDTFGCDDEETSPDSVNKFNVDSRKYAGCVGSRFGRVEMISSGRLNFRGESTVFDGEFPMM